MLRGSNGLNVLLLAAVVMCALSVVTSRHKARKLYVELQKGKEQARQMEVEWGQLQLEQSTWATPARVEKVAAQQLKMQLPKKEQIKFVKLGQSLPRPMSVLPSSMREGAVGAAQVSINGEKPQP